MGAEHINCDDTADQPRNRLLTTLLTFPTDLTEITYEHALDVRCRTQPIIPAEPP